MRSLKYGLCLICSPASDRQRHSLCSSESCKMAEKGSKYGEREDFKILEFTQGKGPVKSPELIFFFSLPPQTPSPSYKGSSSPAEKESSPLVASLSFSKEISNAVLNSWAPSWHFTDRGVREKDFQILKQELQLLLWQKCSCEQAGKDFCL